MEGFRVEDLKALVSLYEKCKDYLPYEDDKELIKLGKKYLCTVLSTIAPAKFREYVANNMAIQRRSQAEKQNTQVRLHLTMQIKISREVWEKVKSTTQVSQKNGKAVHMLKPGIGKKQNEAGDGGVQGGGGSS